MTSSILRTVLISLLAMPMSACVVAPARRPAVVVQAPVPAAAPIVVQQYPDTQEPAPIVAQVEPPSPQTEVVPVSPGTGYVWAPGLWVWEGHRHVWHAGRWMAPRPGHSWAPRTWVRVGGAWHLRGGYWRRR